MEKDNDSMKKNLVTIVHSYPRSFPGIPCLVIKMCLRKHVFPNSQR